MVRTLTMLADIKTNIFLIFRNPHLRRMIDNFTDRIRYTECIYNCDIVGKSIDRELVNIPARPAEPEERGTDKNYRNIMGLESVFPITCPLPGYTGKTK